MAYLCAWSVSRCGRIGVGDGPLCTLAALATAACGAPFGALRFPLPRVILTIAMNFVAVAVSAVPDQRALQGRRDDPPRNRARGACRACRRYLRRWGGVPPSIYLRPASSSRSRLCSRSFLGTRGGYGCAVVRTRWPPSTPHRRCVAAWSRDDARRCPGGPGRTRFRLDCRYRFHRTTPSGTA